MSMVLVKKILSMSKLTSLFVEQLAKTKVLKTLNPTINAKDNQQTAPCNHTVKKIKFNINQKGNQRLKAKIRINQYQQETPAPARLRNGNLIAPEAIEGILASPVEGTIVENRPFIQLNKTPHVIELDQYTNPLTAENPTGSGLATFRLSQLANAVPTFTAHYNRSSNLIDELWPEIIMNASSEKAPIRSLFSKAQKKYETFKLQEFSQVSDTWLPVYPKPANWANIIRSTKNLESLKLDLSNPNELTDGFDLIEDASFSWYTDNGTDTFENKALGTDSKIEEIEMKIMRVDFIREWYNPRIFKLKDWKIDGFEKGFYSSGDRLNNDGVFPLLPISMIIGTEVTVQGSIGQQDQDLINDNIKKNKTFSLGPFVLGSKAASTIIQTNNDKVKLSSNNAHIIGFISELTPFSPAQE